MELVRGNSLICATPEEGRQLALDMALQTAFAIQPEKQAQDIIRGAYANEAVGVIEASHVVALEFATIAAANNYWR